MGMIGRFRVLLTNIIHTLIGGELGAHIPDLREGFPQTLLIPNVCSENLQDE